MSISRVMLLRVDNPARLLSVVVFLGMSTLLAASVCADELPDQVVAQRWQLSQVQVTRSVTYMRRKAKELKADIYQPPTTDYLPGVLMVHGGAWMSGDKIHTARHAQAIAARGYVVVAINYRLAPQYKHPAQIEDCRAGLAWMNRNADQYRIDKQRIAGYGYSAGGHLVSLLGVTGAAENADRESDSESGSGSTLRLKAVVAGGAPCEFRELEPDSERLQFWLGDTRQNAADVYRDASPTVYASSDDPPFFFFVGGTDRLIAAFHPHRLAQQLKAEGVEAKVMLVPGKGHIGAYLDHAAVDAAGQFLDEQLQPPKPVSDRSSDEEARDSDLQDQP